MLIGGRGFKTDLRKDAIGGDFGGDHGGFGLLRRSCKLSKTPVYAVQLAPDMGNLGVVFCHTLPDQGAILGYRRLSLRFKDLKFAGETQIGPFRFLIGPPCKAGSQPGDEIGTATNTEFVPLENDQFRHAQ